MVRNKIAEMSAELARTEMFLEPWVPIKFRFITPPQAVSRIERTYWYCYWPEVHIWDRGLTNTRGLGIPV
jgi:hypothetical protein